MKLNSKYNCRYIYNDVMFFFEELDVFQLSLLLNFIKELGISFNDLNLVITYSRNYKKISTDVFQKIFDLQFNEGVI